MDSVTQIEHMPFLLLIVQLKTDLNHLCVVWEHNFTFQLQTTSIDNICIYKFIVDIIDITTIEMKTKIEIVSDCVAVLQRIRLEQNPQ